MNSIWSVLIEVAGEDVDRMAGGDCPPRDLRVELERIPRVLRVRPEKFETIAHAPSPHPWEEEMKKVRCRPSSAD